MLQNLAADDGIKVAFGQLLPDGIIFNVADDDLFVVLGGDAGKFRRNFHAPNFAGLPLLQNPSCPTHAATDVQDALCRCRDELQHGHVANGLMGIFTPILVHLFGVNPCFCARAEAAILLHR